MFYRDLSEEQTAAFMGILQCVVNKSQSAISAEERSVVLRAPAGTGKTYVARHIAEFLSRSGLTATNVAFTGRAASQLTKNGLPARTCHSLLFKAILDHNGDLLRWEEKTKNEILQDCGDVICCDEGSMIPLSMHKQMTAIGKPIIYLGDYDQLPPVDDQGTEFNVMVNFSAPVFSLVTSRRFDDDSGIGFICAKLRQENSLPRMVKQGLSSVPKSKVFTKSYHEKNQFDVIVCGTNKTRKKLNDLVRNARGYYGETPEVGELVVCLKNDVINNTKINNGEVFRVDNIINGDPFCTYYLTSIDEDNKSVIVRVQNETWQTEKVEFKRNEKFCTFGYAYALSCHKVQGSSFKSVLFVDEDVSYFLDQRRYRYTGCSRAMDKLVVAY